MFDEQIFPATTVICYNFDIGPPMHHHSHVWFIFNLWFPRRFKIYIFSYIYRPNQHNQHTYNFTEYPRKYVKQLTMKLHFDCQFILIYIVTVFCLFVCFVLVFFWCFFFNSWIFIVLAHWNNSTRVDMSLHLDTLFCFRANQSLLLLLNTACLAEKQQIPVL